MNEPLEKLEMGEGMEFIVTINEKIIRPKDAFERSAGKRKGTIDAEALVEFYLNVILFSYRGDIYGSVNCGYRRENNASRAYPEEMGDQRRDCYPL